MPDELHRAIWQRDLSAVNAILDAGADIDTRDRKGWSPLARAIQLGLPEIADRLLERGADIEAHDRRRRTPLFWAAQYEPDRIVERLLALGARVDVSDDHGETPLNLAVQHGRARTVERLLCQPWPRVSQSFMWMDAFSRALAGCRYRIVATFLDAGHLANSFGTQTTQGKHHQSSILIDAVEHSDLRMVKLLLEHGVAVHQKYGHQSPLAHALAKYGPQGEITQLLLAQGAQIRLQEAILAGDLELAESLLASGAEVDIRDTGEQTLLIWASFHGRANAVRLLLRFGADVRASDAYGVDALMGAGATGDVALAERLIQSGSEATMARWTQWTALTYAARAGHVAFLRWFLSHFDRGPDNGISALIAAAANHQGDAVRLLLDAGVDVNGQSGKLKRSALMYSAWYGNVEVSGRLLRHGADANLRDRDGRTPLVLAASAGRKRVIGLLLDHGVDSAQKGKAFLEATWGGHFGTAAILLEAGADPNASGDRGGTALMFAAERGSVGLVQALLDRGADVKAADSLGLTAVMVAERAGRVEIVRLLRDAENL